MEEIKETLNKFTAVCVASAVFSAIMFEVLMMVSE